MQKHLYIIVLCLLVGSCGGSDSEDIVIPTSPTPPGPAVEVNAAPSVPELVYPTDNLLCINNTLDFQWNASTDSNGDSITYELEISKDNQFSEIAHTANESSTTQTFTLEKGLAYYWRVRAKDSKNATSNYTSAFSLYTEGEGISNHLPFLPEVIKPVIGSTLNSGNLDLEWAANDTDGDPLTYVVYFDMNTPPTTVVAADLNLTTFNVNVVSATQYYWKIVVKDNQGGQTIGQVWNFKTD